MTILKYNLHHVGIVEVVPLPAGARIIKIAIQFGKVTFWAIVDSSASTIDRQFILVPTGSAAYSQHVANGTYIDTVFNGSYVWHVFEVPA